MRNFILLLCIVALLEFSTSCHRGHEEARQSRGKGPVKIGLSLDSLQLERWQHDRDAFVAKASQLGAEVFIQSANGVDAVQIRQCENLLTMGVDVLVIVPHNGEVMASAVRSAEAQGVPVISYDRLIRDSNVSLYVSFDNKLIGELQAKYLYARAPAGNYILIGGSPTDNNAHLIREGQMQVLSPAIKRGDIRIIADQWAKDWLPSEALRHTENALTQANNHVAAVVTSNDSTAGGAIQALGEQGLAGRVLVSGQDTDLAAAQRVVEGTQSMTVYKPIKPLAENAAAAAVALARGEKVQSNSNVNNGAKEVPSILLAPIVVDRTNIDSTVIKDGFLKREDIYKNVSRTQWPKD
ncbi:xylose-binding protein [Candidatus Koribacter versatilis Ellin345]|uniref:Xylose-binding protein n=1 Tax=Koribacter versatilis (strain Ellin345) TaxID=204669 RepID=Q1IT90_KORVE|nr:D-xylose ABC transporter substrate-binding protein [Candidatus Koribacter versatilis]ABF39910.1 xylose-binding protein [Candidatus Koribacter versatilis Ellin345]